MFATISLVEASNDGYSERAQYYIYYVILHWNKLEKDFLSKAGVFDISKVPDIYDCIKYDLQHNNTILQCEAAEELYIYAKNMADVVSLSFIYLEQFSTM